MTRAGMDACVWLREKSTQAAISEDGSRSDRQETGRMSENLSADGDRDVAAATAAGAKAEEDDDYDDDDDGLRVKVCV